MAAKLGTVTWPPIARLPEQLLAQRPGYVSQPVYLSTLTPMRRPAYAPCFQTRRHAGRTALTHHQRAQLVSAMPRGAYR